MLKEEKGTCISNNGTKGIIPVNPTPRMVSKKTDGCCDGFETF